MFLRLLLAVWGFFYVSGRSQPEVSGGGSANGGDGGADGDGGLDAPPDAGDLY